MLSQSDLLTMIAPTKLGSRATAAEKAAILTAIARLEDRNPTPRPTEAADLLGGNWRLRYTTSGELLGLDRPPLIRLGEIYQCLRVGAGRVYNVALVNDRTPLVGQALGGLVSVAANFEVVSPRRVQVRFQRLVIGLQTWVGYGDGPEGLDRWLDRLDDPRRFAAIDATLNPEQQQGWLDVTYLDEDLRIGRGNGGSVFVLTRV
jgi:hypothetical protein